MKNHFVLAYHAACMDGTISAAVAMCKLQQMNPDVAIGTLPVSYDDDFDDLMAGLNPNETHIMFLDFSPEEEDFKKYQKAWRKSWTIIDHHESRSYLAELSLRFGKQPNRLFPEIVYNPKRCGAVLTHKTLCGGKIPQILRHVEDRDLWLFKRENTRAVHAGLLLLGYDPEDHLNVLTGGDTALKVIIERGETALMVRKSIVDELVATAYPVAMGNDMTFVVENPPRSLTSDVLNDMLDSSVTIARYALSVTRLQQRKFEYIFGIRSRDGTAADVAAAHGGGGHPNAAGWHGDELPFERDPAPVDEEAEKKNRLEAILDRLVPLPAEGKAVDLQKVTTARARLIVQHGLDRMDLRQLKAFKL